MFEFRQPLMNDVFIKHLYKYMSGYTYRKNMIYMKRSYKFYDNLVKRDLNKRKKNNRNFSAFCDSCNVK